MVVQMALHWDSLVQQMVLLKVRKQVLNWAHWTVVKKAVV